MSDVAAPSRGAPSLAAHLEGVNLAGLARAAGVLLGRDAVGVAAVFARWGAARREALPALPQLCWSTLRPVGVGRPALPAAAILDGVLAGTEHDPEVATAALEEASAVAGRLVTDAPLVEDGVPLADQLRRRALVSATKEFWRTLAATYTDVRPAVVRDDLDGAVAVLERARTQLAPIVERLDVLAHRIAGLEPPVGAAPGASASAPRAAAVLPVTARPAAPAASPTAPPLTGPATTAADATGPLRADGVDAGARPADVDGWGAAELGGGAATAPEARASTQQVRPPAARGPRTARPAGPPLADAVDDAGRPVRRRLVRQGLRTVELVDDGDPSPIPRVPGARNEVLKRKPPREHPFVPIVFLLLATAAALVVLFAVVGSGASA